MVSSQSAFNLDELYRPSVVELARAGNFQAIAHWLNAYLQPQGISARVSANQPGNLTIRVEFSRAPEGDRLVRFICHRLCKLNSPYIHNVRVIAQQAGTAKVLWETTVRVGRPEAPPAASPISDDTATVAATAPAEASLQLVEPVSLVDSIAATPQLTGPVATPTETKTAFIPPSPQLPKLVSLPVQPRLQLSVPTVAKYRSFLPTIRVLKQQKPLLFGAAALAFFLGCGIEVFAQRSNLANFNFPGDLLALFQPAPVAGYVNAALENVPVVPVSTAQAPNDSTITLLFSSDAVLSQEALGSIASVDTLAPYLTADLTFVGLDVPLVDSQSDNNDQTAPALSQLTDRGVDLVSLVANSSDDRDQKQLNQTAKMLKDAGVVPLGAGQTARDLRRPQVFEVRGKRIAFIGYSDSLLTIDHHWSPNISADIKAQITADIQAMRDQVDWVIVNYRWSRELAEYPSTWQVELAHLAIDQGADLVVGHHPSVLQGGEVYEGRAIAYSLGDFIFEDSNNPEQNYDSAVLKVSIRDQQMQLEFLPVQVRQAHPRIVEGIEARPILNYIRQASALFDQPIEPLTVLNNRQLQQSPVDASGHDIGGSVVESDESLPPEVDSFITYPQGSESTDVEDSEGFSSESDGFITDPEQNTEPHTMGDDGLGEADPSDNSFIDAAPSDSPE